MMSAYVCDEILSLSVVFVVSVCVKFRILTLGPLAHRVSLWDSFLFIFVHYLFFSYEVSEEKFTLFIRQNNHAQSISVIQVWNQVILTNYLYFIRIFFFHICYKILHSKICYVHVLNFKYLTQYILHNNIFKST